MLTSTTNVTGDGIRQAIETRDGRMLSGFYAEDAVLRIIDRNNPPSNPREIRGRSAITTFWDDLCSRAIAHQVETTIAEGDRLAFTQDCAYPDGAKVCAFAIVDLRDGKIARHVVVQAWDE
jgi:ketosteroid isomerase-like protein